jgi:hypothetical protein
MPRGDKSSYSSKQKRQAEHIEVNKQDKGGKKSGGGRGKKSNHASSRKGGKAKKK